MIISSLRVISKSTGDGTSTLALKPKFKTGYQWPHKMMTDLLLQIFKNKKIIYTALNPLYFIYLCCPKILNLPHLCINRQTWWYTQSFGRITCSREFLFHDKLVISRCRPRRWIVSGHARILGKRRSMQCMSKAYIQILSMI